VRKLKAGIVSRTDIPKALHVTREIIDKLKKKGLQVCVETETALSLEFNNNTSDISELEGDFIVTIGGDGTILRTVMEMKNSETPIFGINMGRRGFLSEVTVQEVDDALNKVISGDFTLEENMKIASRCPNIDETFPDALNEVLIASSLPSKMLLMSLSVNGNHITDIQADGTLVASPAGSTAYNMSAGGSVMAPNLNALMMTVICPYSYFKSLAVDSRDTITIELLKPRAEGLAIIDGRVYTAVKPLSTIEIFASKHITRFIRFKPFYQRLKRRIAIFQSL
jgi:NAD+ kinase